MATTPLVTIFAEANQTDDDNALVELKADIHPLLFDDEAVADKIRDLFTAIQDFMEALDSEPDIRDMTDEEKKAAIQRAQANNDEAAA